MLKINEDLRAEVFNHPVYQMIKTPEAVRLFMKYHVFCVWDFQSLAKKMQQLCSSPDLPWLPSENRHARRLMNEIILEEESDEHPDGGFCSHFELYLDAMTQAGADLEPINRFIYSVKEGLSIEQALEEANVPMAVREFVMSTFETIKTGKSHEVCASFTRGRETVIPGMFEKLIASLAGEDPAQWSLFAYYLNRHVEVDGDTHGPASEILLESFCKSDAQAGEAVKAAECALRARLALWDTVAVELKSIGMVSC